LESEARICAKCKIGDVVTINARLGGGGVVVEVSEVLVVVVVEREREKVVVMVDG